MPSCRRLSRRRWRSCVIAAHGRARLHYRRSSAASPVRPGADRRGRRLAGAGHHALVGWRVPSCRRLSRRRWRSCVIAAHGRARLHYRRSSAASPVRPGADRRGRRLAGAGHHALVGWRVPSCRRLSRRRWRSCVIAAHGRARLHYRRSSAASPVRPGADRRGRRLAGAGHHALVGWRVPSCRRLSRRRWRRCDLCVRQRAGPGPRGGGGGHRARG